MGDQGDGPYYRRELTRSLKTFLLVGVAPALGSAMLVFLFVKSCIELSAEDSGETSPILGLGAPLVLGVGFLLLGVVLMVVWRVTGHRDFFARRPEVAPPDMVIHAPAAKGA